MSEKETFFVKIWDTATPEIYGVGECAVFRGLSSDDYPDYQSRLAYYCQNLDSVRIDNVSESSIRFGLETAFADLRNGGKRQPFPSDWTNTNNGIDINGLIWMGDYETMRRHIDEKIKSGFRCIKLKIGALQLDKEIQLLEYVRSNFSDFQLQIRLDANGAFSPNDALRILERLARYDIHSIEQPIRQGKLSQMCEICKYSQIPIALDEEIIGCFDYDTRCRLLDKVMPQYIILKPSLCGGFKTADGWIDNAVEREIGWWATSALESNIGLNAIAQWVSNKTIRCPQGLGTGMLYTNNLPSPLYLDGPKLCYNQNSSWDLSSLKWTI